MLLLREVTILKHSIKCLGSIVCFYCCMIDVVSIGSCPSLHVFRKKKVTWMHEGYCTITIIMVTQ